MKYTTLADFPANLRERIKQLAAPGNAEFWIREDVPALSGRSILDVINGPNGESKIEEHLSKIEGYLGG